MDKIFENRMKELSRRAEFSGREIFTDFLNAEEYYNLGTLKHELCPFTVSGGTEFAERIIACFGGNAQTEYPFSIIKITPKSQKFSDELSHRDILGAVMSLGIEREKTGDIIIFDNTAYMFVLDSIAPFIASELNSVKHTSVSCEATDSLPDGAFINFTTVREVVTSLRADCIVAAVFNLSRNNTSALFDNKKIFINSALCVKGSAEIREGDKISVRGFGKFIFDGVQGETKKGRLAITVRKYS